MRYLLAICCALFLVACDGGGGSEPIQYPEESSETLSSSIESSAESSSETASSAVESSSSIVSSSSAVCLSSVSYVYGDLIDERDGQKYRTMDVNGITWMLDNLNYAYLQPTSSLDSSSWCFEHNSDNCAWNGRLYLWSAAMDSAGLFSDDAKGCGDFVSENEKLDCSLKKDAVIRGVCPKGWHLPTYDEYLSCLFLPGDYYRAGDKALEGLFNGSFDSESNLFFDGGMEIGFWLATEFDHKKAYHDNYDFLSLMYSEGASAREAIEIDYKKKAYPVRCVKD